MEVLSKDLLLGNFRASDHGLIVGSFSYSGNSEDELGMNTNTVEEFIGHNPVPVYLGQNYTDKLKLQITLAKNPFLFKDHLYFQEKECRSILRVLTGIKGYQWLKLISHDTDDDLWYRTRVNNVSYKRIGGHVAGIILDMECDSCFAWSPENNVTLLVKANQHFYVFNNTDDLNNYVLPVVSITPSSAGTVSVTNMSDNRTSEIKNVKANEKITVDSRREVITSSITHDLLLDDFNLGWFRLVPDKNDYVSNTDAVISITYRAPRKAGIIE